MRSTQCAALPVVMQCAKTLGIEPASVRGLASATSSKATNIFLSTSTFTGLRTQTVATRRLHAYVSLWTVKVYSEDHKGTPYVARYYDAAPICRTCTY